MPPNNTNSLGINHQVLTVNLSFLRVVTKFYDKSLEFDYYSYYHFIYMPEEDKLSLSSSPNSMSESFARFISGSLHPLVMGPLVFLIISIWGVSGRVNLLAIMIPAILATALIPFLTVAWMVSTNKSRHIDIPEKEKRVFPFLIAIAGYFSASAFYYITDQPLIITAMMIIYGLNTLIATPITKFWKISIHGMAIGGLLGALYYLFGKTVLLGWLLLPVITFSRVTLKAHTSIQVISGFSLGFFLTILQLSIYLN